MPSPSFVSTAARPALGAWAPAVRRVLAQPAWRWLRPRTHVRLERAGAGAPVLLVCVGGEATAAALGTEPPRIDAVAVELAADRVLERTLTLPALDDAALADAVQLEVASASPFPAQDTVFGHTVRERTASGALLVDTALAARQEVAARLAEAGHADGAAAPEVWVLPRAAGAAGAPGAAPARPFRPIVLPGYGEATRQQAERRAFALRLGLLALALALAALLAATPTLIMRARAVAAQRAFDDLRARTTAQVARRDALMQSVERLQGVGRLAAEQTALPPLLDMLTSALPDGAWLTAMRIEGTKVTLTGSADDAAALVGLLARQRGVSEARLASPATRQAGAAKENFVIELKVDGGVYGPARAASGAAA